MTSEDAAAILGVDADASTTEIEIAYRQRARMSHPDRFATAPPAQSATAAAEFIRITEARTLLLRLAAERPHSSAGVSVPLTSPVPLSDGAGSAAGPSASGPNAPRPMRSSPWIFVWSTALVFAAIFSFLGGVLPFSPWNALLLIPLLFAAVGFAVTGRQNLLIAAVVMGIANAIVAIIFTSFGSLVALEVLLAPVIALIVVGIGRRRRASRL